MTTATRSRRIVYRAYWEDYYLGEGDDRDDADDLIYLHANRNQRLITDGYRVEVKLRTEGD